MLPLLSEKYVLGPEIAGDGDAVLFIGTLKPRKSGVRAGDERFTIKRLPEEAVSQEFQGFVAKELSNLKHLQHDNIATLKDVCRDEKGNMFIVTEYCAGGELLKRLAQRDSFTQADARKILQEVAQGLAFLHSKNITHRDLRFENILLSSDSDNSPVKLLCFGLEPCRTSTTASRYVAPELLKKELYTPAVDMWAFGVLAFTLLCGYPPFQGATDAELLRQIKGGTFSFDIDEWEGIADQAKDMIRHLLKLDPSKRLSASAVIEHPWMVTELKHTSLSFALDRVKASLEKKSLKEQTEAKSAKLKSKSSTSSLDSQQGIKTKKKAKKPKAIHPLDLDLFQVSLLPLVGSILVALLMFHLSPASVSGKEQSSLFDVAFGSCMLLYLAILHSSRCVTLGLHYLGEILWGCNMALLLAGVGITTNRPLMVGTAVCIVAVDQICWYIDVIGYMLTGKFPVGVAKYMKAPTTTWVHALTGTHHLWFIPLATAWLGPHGGIPQGCYWGSVLVTTIIALLARLLTPYAVIQGVDNKQVHVWNINLCYEFYEDVAIPPLHVMDHKPAYLFLPFLVLICNFILNVVPVAVVIALSRVLFGGPPFLATDWSLGFATPNLCGLSCFRQ